MTRKTVGNGEPTSSHPFVLGSRKTQKNTGDFCSGIWENAEEHRSFSFWGPGKTQKNTGHFRSGLFRNAEKWTEDISVFGFCETQTSFRSGIWELILGCTETQRMWTVLFLCWGFVRHRHPFVLGIWENAEEDR